MREPMKTIKSFQVDHTKLQKGLYLSRVDGDCVTYDIRMCTPNGGIYLQNAGLHTFEHLFATYVRNSAHSDEVVYVGPMGCRTGFYFIARDSMSWTCCGRPSSSSRNSWARFPAPASPSAATTWTTT